ncbi:metallophosphatase [Rhizocola hellebori]|uniref:Metallophosphatase n=1 Tax=Rhizocola hellebori TaxID=1392758 RepID=A0A8J3VKF3_9ACTN|nr:metallophosphatase [Rhizocola hellebori]
MKTITLSAVGDIIMGVAGRAMPANDGRDFFAKVKHLFLADLVMGNMEEPLTDDTGYVKCRPEQTTCNQFRVPPSYAKHLKDAGFHLLNQANNHGYDFGPKGYTNTQKALESQGLKHTGARGQITLVDVSGVRVAVLGFSSYPRDNSLTDLNAAKAVVEKAAGLADVVVIQVHWGTEGADKTHVKPGTEYFLGENRGDPIRFSHTVIDAGADLIIGHGPHTLRAMEVYKGRLIAYSLGNFAGGRGLKGEGNLGWGGVLKATLDAQGALVSGHFASTYFTSSPGVPQPDPQNRGLDLVRKLSQQDFPSSGARFDVSGAISTL